MIPTTAYAHVKWFENYEVSQNPVPIMTTLALPHFWLAAVLVLGLFLATTLLERRVPGVALSNALDAVTRPLHERADNFLVAVLAGFFVVLFATGGVYLTPELKTEAEWVPWAQLAIALLAISRKTRAAAALLIVVLWVVALKDYDLFHLFDYLALGLGLAGYLLLSSFREGTWHYRRFGVLRWGVALALMWSSMEKFMYPEWFLPLLEDKPFIAFGIAFEPYTTMAGVAEFTLGFGLLWSPLVRRLSATMLFVVMFAAVYPFGRIDLVGHATILVSLLIIITDPLRDHALEITPRDHRASLFVPAGLAVALATTMISYASLHNLIYDRATGQLAALLRPSSHKPVVAAEGTAPGSFWQGFVHYHLPEGVNQVPAPTAAMMQTLDRMQGAMLLTHITGDRDHDFAALMVTQRQSAKDMARIYLKSGRDPGLRQVAEEIVRSGEAEIQHIQDTGQLAP